jgi:hypothetical protein
LNPTKDTTRCNCGLTGFVILEPTLGGKWVEMLKEIAPRVERVAFLFNPAQAPTADYYLNSFKAAAVSLGLETTVAAVGDIRLQSKNNGARACASWGITSTCCLRRCCFSTAASSSSVLRNCACRRSINGPKWPKREACSAMAPDDTIWLTDDADHTVRQCTLEGKVLLTLGILASRHPS